MPHKLHIKNMVCNRCIEAVKEEFEKNEVLISKIKLGEVEIEELLDSDKKKQITDDLSKRGFELLEDKNSQLIENIKSLLVDQIHYKDKPLNTNYSTYLEKEIGKDYNTLSSLFSSVEGVTIERYIILQKLEKIKELLIYDEINLSQIAHRLGYSSVQHLSNQFKKNTGMTPTEFRRLQDPDRKTLDNIT
ncbi:MAG: AraC family transcriptional regulator [Cyclobacteriaceae bacterium]